MVRVDIKREKLQDVLQEREGASFEQFWMILKHFELYQTIWTIWDY